MPATGALICTPASMSDSVEPQTLAIEDEPLLSRISETMRDGVREVELVRQDRQQGALGEGAVADVAALGAAHEAGLAHRVRREVVVVDVALLVLDAEAVDALELAGAAQREQAHRLRLAAREEGAAVRARDDADLAADRPDLVGRAAVGAALLDGDAVADDVLLDLGERALDLRDALGRRSPRRGAARRRPS